MLQYMYLKDPWNAQVRYKIYVDIMDDYSDIYPLYLVYINS